MTAWSSIGDCSLELLDGLYAAEGMMIDEFRSRLGVLVIFFLSKYDGSTEDGCWKKEGLKLGVLTRYGWG
jgi:hypothetical protein